MNLTTLLLSLLCLGACSQTTQEGQNPIARSPWARHRLVERDVDAIMQGIARARAENSRLARAQRDPAVARPGS